MLMIRIFHTTTLRITGVASTLIPCKEAVCSSRMPSALWETTHTPES